MNWRPILHSRLSDLAHGRTSEYQRPSRWSRSGLAKVASAPRLLRRLDVFYLISLLARIVKCNAPLAPGLTAAAVGAPSYQIGHALHKLSRDVQSGLRLHEAMRRQPYVFPAHYADLVETGERTGTLPETLDELMKTIVERKGVKRDLRGLMVYVAIVLTIYAFFTLFIDTKVIPVFREIIQEFGDLQSYAPLGYGFRILDQSRWLILGAAVAAGAIAGSIVFARFLKLIGKTRTLRRVSGFIGLRLPIVGRFVRASNLAMATSILAELTRAGCPLDVALESVAGSSMNSAFSSLFLRLRDRVRQGQSLQQAAQHEPLLPKSFSATASMADYYGDLPAALSNLASFYKQRLYKHVRLVKPVLMPVLVGSMGLLVFTTFFTTFIMIISMAEAIIESM